MAQVRGRWFRWGGSWLRCDGASSGGGWLFRWGRGGGSDRGRGSVQVGKEVFKVGVIRPDWQCTI